MSINLQTLEDIPLYMYRIGVDKVMHFFQLQLFQIMQSDKALANLFLGFRVSLINAADLS